MDDLITQKLMLEERLKKALSHLDYSYKKVIKLSPDVEKLDDEMLQTWESFAIRFVRVCNIFLDRYVPILVRLQDPGFSGTMRDFLNAAEKRGIISSAQEWLVIRELRNINNHEYSDKDMAAFFETLRNNCPKLREVLKP